MTFVDSVVESFDKPTQLDTPGIQAAKSHVFFSAIIFIIFCKIDFLAKVVFHLFKDSNYGYLLCTGF